MLLERMGQTVTLERPDGETVDVPRVLYYDADASDQSVMDIQTRFINQARYKGDSKTLTLLWPKSAPHDLMDCHVWVRGERFRIYANPTAPSATPTLVGYDLFVTATHPMFLYDAMLLKSVREQDEWGVWHTREYEPTPVKVNLLRLSEDMAFEAGQHGYGGVVLLELPPDTWDRAYVAFEFQGHKYSITSVDTAHDVVVIGGTMEVTDYSADIPLAATPDPTEPTGPTDPGGGGGGG